MLTFHVTRNDIVTNDQILQALKQLESEHSIRIVYACESGSRAWGFPSPDSDYDVRFIYAHPVDWYLSVFPGKDTIDLPISGDSDLAGWDLRKCFGLLLKSNCALIEWLSSPIVYREDTTVSKIIQDMVAPSFLPINACHHYLAMAKHKFDEITCSDKVKLKSYFYALRAILCALHIVQQETAPPMQILALTHFFPAEVKPIYDELLTKKMESTEAFRANRISQLDEFIRESLIQVENNLPQTQQKIESARLDESFRQALTMIWGD